MAAAKRVEAGTGFVRIRVEGVDKRVDERRIQHRLAEVYRPLLETGALRLTVNAALVAPVVLPALERDDFRVNAARGRIAGWIGVVDPERRPSDFTPGIRCYKLGRLVVMGEFFGHPGPAQEPGMSRLIGEVDIPNVPLTMNKSDFDRDGAAWIAVEDRMHRVLAPWTRRLARDGGAPPPASALKVAEQVRRLLSQALRLADRPELFSGDLGSLGPAPAKGIGESELPLEKSLANFDVKRLPAKAARQLRMLLEGDFLQRKENLLVFGAATAAGARASPTRLRQDCHPAPRSLRPQPAGGRRRGHGRRDQQPLSDVRREKGRHLVSVGDSGS